MFRALLVCALLVACSDTPERSVRVNRKQAAQSLADQPPKRSVYRFESGELTVLDIATTVGGYADSQRCFLWRDAEFRTASLQCPNDSPGDLGHTPPERNTP